MSFDFAQDEVRCGALPVPLLTMPYSMSLISFVAVLPVLYSVYQMPNHHNAPLNPPWIRVKPTKGTQTGKAPRSAPSSAERHRHCPGGADATDPRPPAPRARHTAGSAQPLRALQGEIVAR